MYTHLPLIITIAEKWLFNSVKCMDFNLRRIKVKQRRFNIEKIKHVMYHIYDMQGLERLIGICRNLPLPISTHSSLLLILVNLASENIAGSY